MSSVPANLPLRGDHTELPLRGDHTELPLRGLRIVVTRALDRALGLAEKLEILGAEVERLPLFEIVPPEDPEALARAYSELTETDRFHWVVFTSAATPMPTHRGSAKFAAIGPATASALEAHGLEPDWVANESHGAGLARELLLHLKPGDRVLLPQASDARTELAQVLRAHDIQVATVVAYQKRLLPVSDQRLNLLFGPATELSRTWVTFTSPRIVTTLSKLLGPDWPRVSKAIAALSIGPTTSAALRAQGIEPAAVAVNPSEDALVEALVAAVARHA